VGVEVFLVDYSTPDWIRAQVLDKMLPEDLLKTIFG
jgi:hypothetical protein